MGCSSGCWPRPSLWRSRWCPRSRRRWGRGTDYPAATGTARARARRHRRAGTNEAAARLGGIAEVEQVPKSAVRVRIAEISIRGNLDRHRPGLPVRRVAAVAGGRVGARVTGGRDAIPPRRPGGCKGIGRYGGAREREGALKSVPRRTSFFMPTSFLVLRLWTRRRLGTGEPVPLTFHLPRPTRIVEAQTSTHER